MKKLFLSLSILACISNTSTSIQARSEYEIQVDAMIISYELERIFNDTNSTYNEKETIIKKFTAIIEEVIPASEECSLAILYFQLSLALNNRFIPKNNADLIKKIFEFLPTIPEYKDHQEKLIKNNFKQD